MQTQNFFTATKKITEKLFQLGFALLENKLLQTQTIACCCKESHRPQRLK